MTDRHICTQDIASHNTVSNGGCPGSELVNTLNVYVHSITSTVIHDNNINLSSYLMQLTNMHCSCFQHLKYDSLYASSVALAMVFSAHSDSVNQLCKILGASPTQQQVSVLSFLCLCIFRIVSVAHKSSSSSSPTPPSTSSHWI